MNTHALILIQETEALALDHALVNENVGLCFVIGLDKTCVRGKRRRACGETAKRYALHTYCAAGKDAPKPFVLLNHLTEPSAMPRAPSGSDERTTRENESILVKDFQWREKTSDE